MSNLRQFAGAEPWADYFARAYGDKRGLPYGGGNLQPLPLILDSAQSLKSYALQGDFLYLDKDSTGSIRIKFAMSQARTFPLKPNDKMNKMPYWEVLIEWDAQAGKTATLWFGYGVEFLPSQTDIATIGSITDPIAIANVANTHALFGLTAASQSVLAANLDRRYLAIQVPAASADSAYVRSDGVAATFDAASHEINPGETWVPNPVPRGEITGRRGGVGNINIHVIEGE